MQKYRDYFKFKNIKIFSQYKKYDYIIKLIFNIKSLYESLYTFLEKKLQILKNYFLENLILKRIRESINSIKIFILFVFKKNKNLYLYIDYRELNAIIIKNYYSFFLIDETLNHLINITYFIKLNLKNVYYRIKIRYKNK